jgi:hypothetical protein
MWRNHLTLKCISCEYNYFIKYKPVVFAKDLPRGMYIYIYIYIYMWYVQFADNSNSKTFVRLALRAAIVKDRPILSSEMVLRKYYD